MCISAVFNILSCVFDTGQHSLPYIIAGLTMVREIFPFNTLERLRSQRIPVDSLYLIREQTSYSLKAEAHLIFVVEDEVCNSLLPVLTCEAVDLINQTRQDALPTLLPWVAGSTRRHSGGGGLPPQIARDVEQRTLIKET
ncbi:hypothetical protein Y032_0041g368 [Ancylostoma ceylanicum]|uniref:Uncharacterized protein n=1 Tax=Ancylostoma ceylanicum TaxID=53326 RepID=A0A016UFR2_9BILA|nr:hypothetical protein Y032_0041g368 [Ancylostoma ceylanicum]